MQDEVYLAQVAFEAMQKNLHRPFISGKANKPNIEEGITIGILSGQLGPMDEEDVDVVCDYINALIETYGMKDNE